MYGFPLSHVVVVAGILSGMDKSCRTCGKAKPHSDFYRMKRSADGFQYSCKACQRDQRRNNLRLAAEPRKPEISDSLPGEDWLPVVDYEGQYSISSFGRVRSERREVAKMDGTVQLIHARELSAVTDSKGYLRVNLFKGNIGATCYLHQLVMVAFVGPPPPALEIRHLNGQRTDNRLSNLAYGTRSENAYDTVRHNMNHNAVKTECPRGHAYDLKNTYIDAKGSRICRACSSLRQKRPQHSAAEAS